MNPRNNSQRAGRSSSRPGWIAICLILFLQVFSIPQGRAQDGISFGEVEVQNEFPIGLTFKITASSSEGEITKAKLVYKLRNATSQTQAVLEFTPAPDVELTHTWDTSNITIPPARQFLSLGGGRLSRQPGENG